MEPEFSLLYSKELPEGPYPEPVKSSPYFFKILFKILSSHVFLSPSGSSLKLF
jgi:hypothetical protein